MLQADQDIADILGVSLSGVKLHLDNARGNLAASALPTLWLSRWGRDCSHSCGTAVVLRHEAPSGRPFEHGAKEDREGVVDVRPAPACLFRRVRAEADVGVVRPDAAFERCVISAYLSAVFEGDTIVCWIRNSAFSVQEVLFNGTLAPLDLTPAKLALQADGADMKASKAGIVGISSRIAGRRIQEQNTGNLPSKLREAAIECATVQILDKIQGHSVVGVRLYDH
jgi:hypothetical protein